MVETGGVSPGMAESEITAMKETLRAQQQLLQKLYAELDQEREASATAASEAMEMILRLQGEKAAVKMEASHYKRMAEEKIDHAEATLEVFEELMYQKEMEIASLEYQVLAYKHKLLTFGADFSASEFEFPEDLLLMNRDDQQQNGDNGQSSTVRRLGSLPPIPYKNNLRIPRKRDRSPSPAPIFEIITPKTAESSDHEDFSHATLDSYWNQIKTLDEKVKVISDCKESGEEELSANNPRIRRGVSCSVVSQASSKATCDQTDSAVLSVNSTRRNSCEGSLDREVVATNVHDVFEVPQTCERHEDNGKRSEKHEIGNDHGKRKLEKWILDADNRLTKPDPVSEETVESHVKHDIDKLKRKLSAQELRIASPNDMKSVVWQKKKGGDADRNSPAEFQKLNRRVERLERERVSNRKEIRHEGEREEQLRLLKDICSQLKLIQTEVRSLKPKKAAPKEEHVPLDPLQEAMLYFWM